MKVDTLPKNQLKKNVPTLRAGQVVRVHERIKEGDKERTQVFEGLVIAVKHGKGLDGTFTVRKMGAGNIGVERIFPIHMPAIEKIEVLRQEKVRRSKLYYVRRQVGQKVKKRKTKLENLIFDMGGTVEEEAEVVEDEVATEDVATEATKEEKTEEVAEDTKTEEGESDVEETKEEAVEEVKEEKSEEVKEEKKEEESTEEEKEGSVEEPKKEKEEEKKE